MSDFCACGTCIFWGRKEHHDGLCRRHAPSTYSESDEVAHWPQTYVHNGCGEGTTKEDAHHRLVTCGSCLYWHRPAHGLNPQNRRDQMAGWWDNAGRCGRFAPRPSREPGARAFWYATSADDSCADGKIRVPLSARDKEA